MEKGDSEKCHNPKCHNKVHVRGVCGTCYMKFRQMVADKKTTWEKLEGMGVVLPPKRRPNTAIEWFKNLKDGKRPS